MATPKVHICGKADLYIPEAECTECEQLENRVTALEETRLEATDILAGDNITIDYPESGKEVVINADLSNYYNKQEVDDLIAGAGGELTKAAILNALGYRETTIKMIDTEGNEVEVTVLVADV